MSWLCVNCFERDAYQELERAAERDWWREVLEEQQRKEMVWTPSGEGTLLEYSDRYGRACSLEPEILVDPGHE